MQKVVRNSLAAILSLAALSACGDKVSVLGPTTPVPVTAHITSVTINGPNTYTLGTLTGNTLSFAETVVADAGFTGSRAVVWSSSNTAVFAFSAASTAATGVVGGGTGTALTAGSSVISAKSVVDGVTANFVLTVSASGAGGTATVNVSTVTQGGLLTPVQIDNVAGQIDVTLNVEPGGQKLDSVQVTIDGQPVATQKLSSAALQAALRAEANIVPQQITLSVNTAVYDTSGACTAALGASAGTVAWTTCTNGVWFVNGTKVLGAKLWINGQTAQGVGTNQLASNTVSLTFQNVDGFYVSQLALNNRTIRPDKAALTVVTTAATATVANQNSIADAAGHVWFQAGNGLLVRSVAVMYSGRVVLTRNLVFTSATSGAFPLSVTHIPVAGTSFVVSQDIIAIPAAFADTGVVSVPSALAVDGNAVTVVNQTNACAFAPPAVACAGAGPIGVINGQNFLPGLSTALLANATIGLRLLPIRLDNTTPAASFALTGTGAGTPAAPGNNAGIFNWVNGSYVFSLGVTTAAVADPGVGYSNGLSAATTAVAAGTFGNAIVAGTAGLALADVAIAVGPSTATIVTTGPVSAAPPTGYTLLAPVNGAASTAAVLAESNANFQYSGSATVMDLLGNFSTAILKENVANPVCAGSAGTSAGAPGIPCIANGAPAVTRGTFGVDKTAPVVRYADTQGINATSKNLAAVEPTILDRAADSVRQTFDRNFRFDYVDVVDASGATIGGSGFVGSNANSNGFPVPAGSPQVHTVVRLSNALTPSVGPGANSCIIGSGAVNAGGTACATQTAVGYGGGLCPAGSPAGCGVLPDNWVRGALVPLVGIVPAPPGTLDGYYSYATQVRDMAGNFSLLGTRRSAVDPLAPVLTNIAVQQGQIVGGSPVTFTPSASDDLELTAGQLTLQYPNVTGIVGGMNLMFPFNEGCFFVPAATPCTSPNGSPFFNPIIGTKWDATLTTPFSLSGLNGLAVNNFIDQIETVQPVAAVAPLVPDAPLAGTNASSRPSLVTGDVRDVFGTLSGTAQTTAIPLPQFSQAFASWSTLVSVGGASTISRWRIVCPANVVSDVPAPSSASITLQLYGPTGQSTVPFPAGKISLWQQPGATANYVRMPGTNTVKPQDNGTNRIWTITYTFSNALPIGVATTVRALGFGNVPVGAQDLMLGNALVTNTCTFTP